MSAHYNPNLEADARLIVLRQLAKQNDGRLNDTILHDVLDAFGHRRSRDWVQTQLRALQEVGGVTLAEIGTVMIAAITRAGFDHVERRGVLAGVLRPRPGE